MCICLWKCAPPLRQWVCPWRDRGREGSEGTQVIEVSPPLPFFSRASHPILPPPPALSTQQAQLRSPSPHQLAPVIPHFLLNATPSALSLLTSQHPLWGNGKAVHKTGGERTQTVLLLSTLKIEKLS